MSSSTHERDMVANIAKRQPARALRLARSITDAWFRCQALSYVALEISSTKERHSILNEAFSAGNKLSEPNRVVTVSAWPLKVLSVRGDDSRLLKSETERLLTLIATEPSPVRRADALRFVVGAVIRSQRELALHVIRRFASSCLQRLQNGKRNRKGEYLLVTYIPAIQQLDPSLAAELLAGLTPSRAQQAIDGAASTQRNPFEIIDSWPNI